MSGLLTGIVSAFVFGTVILLHELGHFFMARRCGIRVLELSIGMGPALWSTERNGTQYSLRLLPVGGYVGMEDEDGETEKAPSIPNDPDIIAAESAGIPFPQAKPHKRLLVLVAGACMNFLLGFLLLVVLVNQNDHIVSRTVSVIGENALCGQTGLQAGDTILAVNGRRCFVAGDILYELSRTLDARADFTVRRNGKRVELPAVQFDTQQAEDGTTHMQLGFAVEPVEKNFLTVPMEALRFTLYFGRIVFSSFMDMVRGRVSINDLSGPVGIVSAIGEAVSYGWRDVLSLMALITINLGVVNLLPLPALDGGKSILVLVEMIIRRPVPTKVQMAINALGMALLFAVLIFVTTQDILRLM